MLEFQVNDPTGERDEGGEIIPLANGTFMVVWSRQANILIPGSGQVRAQLFAADGTEIGTEIRIDSGAGSYPTPGGGLQLANGNIVVLFQSSAPGLPSGSAIWAQILSPVGVKLGSEFQLNLGGGYATGSPLVPTSDGGFVVISERPAVAGDVTSWDVFGQRFDATGTAAGAEFRVNTAATGFQGLPSVAAVTGGGYVVVWETRDPAADGSASAVLGQRYDANSQPIGGPFLVNTQTDSQQYSPTVASLSGGGFVVTWNDDSLLVSSTRDARIAQIFDATGAKVGGEIRLQPPGAFTTTSGLKVTSLNDGGFVVIWDGSLAGAPLQPDIYAAVYSATGDIKGSYVRVNTVTTGYQGVPSVEQIANGDLVFTFSSMAQDGGALMARILSLPHITTSAGTGDTGVLSLNENGAAVTTASATGLGGASAVWSITGGADAALFQINPATGALSFIASPDYDNPTDAGANNVYDVTIAVRGELLYDEQVLQVSVLNLADGVTITGSNQADTIDGSHAPNNQPFVTNNEDTIFGRGGNDVIAGLGGADVIDGGTGNDFLYGGTGNDTLIGGDGADYLQGDEGDDTMRGGAGNDTYIVQQVGDVVTENANEGIDLVQSGISYTLGANVENLELLGIQPTDGTGNELDNLITSYVGEHLLRGLGGNDTLRGGDDAERLEGGDGNDTLDGGAGVNALFGGDGNDRLIVGASGSGSSVDGGTGTDTLAVSGAVSLGSISNIEAIELAPGANLMLTGTQFLGGLAVNTAITGSGTITINIDTPIDYLFATSMSVASTVSFVINGSSSGDVIKAANVSNTIYGGAGSDFIRGFNQVDRVDGGADPDKIIGAGGADILTGGGGNDQFRYFAGSDSGTGAAADHITDFTSGSDTLNFAFDSDPGTPGIQALALSYINTQTFHATGGAEVRYGTVGADLRVELDLNGDGLADMHIVLDGLAGQTLASADFVGTSTAGSAIGPGISDAVMLADFGIADNGAADMQYWHHGAASHMLSMGHFLL